MFRWSNKASLRAAYEVLLCDAPGVVTFVSSRVPSTRPHVLSVRGSPSAELTSTPKNKENGELLNKVL